MPVASIVSKRTYIGRESVAGTASPANRVLEGLNIRAVPNSTRAEVRPSGSTMRTSRPLVQNWSTFSLGDGSFLDYNSGLLLFQTLMGVPVTTTPAGGTVTQDHNLAYAADGLNTRPTYTFITGYRNGNAEQSIRNVFQSFGFTFSRTAAPGVTGSGYGRDMSFNAAVGVNESFVLTPTGTITAGTFALVYGGGTVNVVYNASSGSLLTALNTLLGAGGTANLTYASGGTLPAAPATITIAGGTLANTDLNAISVTNTGLTGGSIVYSEYQKGGVITIPVRAVQAPEWSVYMDNLTSGGTIGTTKVRPYSGEFTFNGLVNPDWVVDAATSSYDDDVLQVPDLSLNIVGRNESAMRTIYNALIAGDQYGVRFEAVGPLTGEGTLRYTMRVDAVVEGSENIGQFGDEGGAETIPLPLTIASNSAYLSGGFAAFIRNRVASI